MIFLLTIYAFLCGCFTVISRIEYAESDPAWRWSAAYAVLYAVACVGIAAWGMAV